METDSVQALVEAFLSPDQIRHEARVGDGRRVDLLAVSRLNRTALAQLPDRLLEFESVLALRDDSQERRSGSGATEPRSGRGVDIAVTVLPWNVKTDFPRTQAAADAAEILGADAVRQKLHQSTAAMNVVLSDMLYEQLTDASERWDRERFEEVWIQTPRHTLKVWIRHGAHHATTERTILERKVENLRDFEREMRTRVKSYAGTLQRRLEALNELDSQESLQAELVSFKEESETRLMAYLESQQNQLEEHILPAEGPALDRKSEALRSLHQEYRSRLLALIEKAYQQVTHRRDTPLHNLMPFAPPPDEPYPTPLHRSLAELKEFADPDQLVNLNVKPPRPDPVMNLQ